MAHNRIRSSGFSPCLCALDHMVHLESLKRKKFQRKGSFPFGNYPDCIIWGRKLASGPDSRLKMMKKIPHLSLNPHCSGLLQSCLLAQKRHLLRWRAGLDVRARMRRRFMVGSSNRVLTALHAEFQALLWTMKFPIGLDYLWWPPRLTAYN